MPHPSPASIPLFHSPVPSTPPCNILWSLSKFETLIFFLETKPTCPNLKFKLPLLRAGRFRLKKNNIYKLSYFFSLTSYFLPLTLTHPTRTKKMLGQTANMQTGDAMEVEQDETFMVEELEALGVNAGDGTCPIKTLSVLLSLHFTSTHPFFPSSLLPFFPSSLLPTPPLHPRSQKAPRQRHLHPQTATLHYDQNTSLNQRIL